MVNAPEDRGDFNYSCEYTFNSTTVVTREGVWQSSTQVDCIPPPRLYTASGNETAELQLKWGKHGIYYYITEEPIGNGESLQTTNNKHKQTNKHLTNNIYI